jgi:vacuolar-type H+-ATPase subunit H
MAYDPLPLPAATTADEAIALVLRHECAAREAIAAAQAEALHLAEAARADARAIAARAERRMRRVATAFEREAQARTAALDAQAAAMAQGHVATPQETAQLARAVQLLAAELTGGAP